MHDVDEPQEPQGESWWTGAKEIAAVDVAEDILTNEQIAEKAGIVRRTLQNWKEVEAFSERVAQLRSEIRERSKQIGVGNQVLRIERRNKRWTQLGKLIDKVYDKLDGTKVIGTMFMERVRTLAALHREELALEKQVAIENGDWTEDKVGDLPTVLVD